MSNTVNILDFIEKSKKVHSKLHNDLGKLKFTTELICKQYYEANKLIIDEFNSLFKGKLRIENIDNLYNEILEKNTLYKEIRESIDRIDISNDLLRYSELENFKDIDIKDIRISQSTESWYITIDIKNLYLMLNKLVELKYNFRFLTSNFQEKDEIVFRFSTHHHLENNIITFKNIDVSVMFNSCDEDFIGKEIEYNIYFDRNKEIDNKNLIKKEDEDSDFSKIINQMKTIHNKKRKVWNKSEFKYIYNNLIFLRKKEEFLTNRFLRTVEEQMDEIKKDFSKRFNEKLVL